MWTAAKQMYPSVLGLVQRMEGFNSQVFADFDNTTSRTAAALSAANKAAAELDQDKVKPSPHWSQPLGMVLGTPLSSNYIDQGHHIREACKTLLYPHTQQHMQGDCSD